MRAVRARHSLLGKTLAVDKYQLLTIEITLSAPESDHRALSHFAPTVMVPLKFKVLCYKNCCRKCEEAISCTACISKNCDGECVQLCSVNIAGAEHNKDEENTVAEPEHVEGYFLAKTD